MGRAAWPVRQTQSYLFLLRQQTQTDNNIPPVTTTIIVNTNFKLFIFARYEAQLSSNAVMPASLYQSNFNLERISSTEMDHSSSAVKLAMELANLCAFNNIQDLEGQSCLSDHFNLGNGQTLAQINDELNARRSQNMTECVPVPTSEHVAEIVGRQGCKIKALRAKTNTYIKTPVRGEEPVFVVTGRKEDVSCAKREILSAAEHFSQIRASRKSNINSTLAFGQLMANTPGQTTVQVRVPYRVVGLVVGPKGATIKRIQQQTHTYIVTPSRDKEPVFEVTGLPENVDAARKEIEAHIALRTGSGPYDGSGLEGSLDDNSPTGWSGPGPVGSSILDSVTGNGNAKLLSEFSSNSILSSGINSLSGSSSRDHFCSNDRQDLFLSNNRNELSRLHSLLDGNTNYDSKFDVGPESSSSIGSLWRCSDSHDSGIGHSPPYDSGDGQNLHNGTAIWNELGKVLGGMDSPIDRHSPAILNAAISKPSHDRSSFMDLTPRSASIDLGIPMGSSTSPSCTNQGINNVVDSQTNSLPFTLNGLINHASLSSSLSTLSISRSENSSTLLDGIVSGGHGLSRQSTTSPVDQVNDSNAFSSGSDPLW